MKKIFVFAAAAAFALCACDKTGTKVDGSSEKDSAEGLVLNELDGQSKFIELYNTTDKEISLEGVTLVKYDVAKEGGKSTTWEGAKGLKIAANGCVVLESSDLADPNEKGDPNYKYESDDHVFKGGLSPKKNIKIELYNANNVRLDVFARGTEGSLGWNEEKYAENETCSFSRVPNGTGEFAYAAPTKGAENGAKVGEIEQQPK